MNFPFVSRASHDRELAALERLLAHAEQSRDDAKADAAQAQRLHDLEFRRYTDLLDKYHALKATGAVLGAVPVRDATGAIVAPKAEPSDPLKLIIATQCGGDLRKRGMMLAQLAADRAEGLSEEEIETRIATGITPEGGVPV